jgi:hypothetical protein
LECIEIRSEVLARGNDTVVMRSSSRQSTVTANAWTKPAFAIGDFVVLVGETFAAMVRPPFAWRELLDQIWFVARVSIVPTLVLSIPYTAARATCPGPVRRWRRSPRSVRWSRRSSFPALAPQRCAPISVHAPFARRSTP